MGTGTDSKDPASTGPARPEGSVKADPKRDPGPGFTRQLGQIARATHPKLAVAVGAVTGIAAFNSGRPARESVAAGAALLVVNLVLGLVNDITDRRRDHDAGISGKPIAEEKVPAGNASFVAVCLSLLLVPLSLQSGTAAAVAVLGILVVGLVYNRWLRPTWLSWLPWAATYALIPAFLAYGGWGLGVHGGPPTWQVTGTSALLGVGLHFLTSLPDLVADNKTGVRHLPLRIALRTGASPLLLLTVVWLGAAGVALAATGYSGGLRQ